MAEKDRTTERSTDLTEFEPSASRGGATGTRSRQEGSTAGLDTAPESSPAQRGGPQQDTAERGWRESSSDLEANGGEERRPRYGYYYAAAMRRVSGRAPRSPYASGAYGGGRQAERGGQPRQSGFYGPESYPQSGVGRRDYSTRRPYGSQHIRGMGGQSGEQAGLEPGSMQFGSRGDFGRQGSFGESHGPGPRAGRGLEEREEGRFRVEGERGGREGGREWQPRHELEREAGWQEPRRQEFEEGRYRGGRSHVTGPYGELGEGRGYGFGQDYAYNREESDRGESERGGYGRSESARAQGARGEYGPGRGEGRGSGEPGDRGYAESYRGSAAGYRGYEPSYRSYEPGEGTYREPWRGGYGEEREERRSRWQREPLTAGEIMTRDVKAVTKQSTLQNVAQIMKDENCGIVPIVDEDHRLKGVVTDRDLVIRTLAEGRSPSEVKVEDVMTEDVEAVTPDEELKDVIELMGRKQIRRVPVVDRDDRLLGIISIGDVANRADYDEDLQEALEKISSKRSFWGRLWT